MTDADIPRPSVVIACGFEPWGRRCPNPADVVVTVGGAGLPTHEVPTCATCLPDWTDHVRATARPITTGR